MKGLIILDHVVLKLKKFSRFIDRVNHILGNVVAWLSLAVVLLVFIITITRYVFNRGSIWWQEMVMYLHSLLLLIPAALVLQKNIHVRIDIFYSKFSAKRRALINIGGTILLLFPFVIAWFILAWDYVLSSWRYFEGSRETGGLNGVYLLKTTLLLVPAMLFFQGVSELIKEYCVYRGLDS